MKIDKKIRKIRRKRSVRGKVFGTSERPRLTVYKSLKHIHLQIIDDTKGNTLCSASTMEKDVEKKCKNYSNKNYAKIVGELLSNISN
jgi:large subunit ribosomal protein L18